MFEKIDFLIKSDQNAAVKPLTLDFKLGEIIYLATKFKNSKSNILEKEIEIRLNDVFDNFSDYDFRSSYSEGFEGFFNALEYIKKCGIIIDETVFCDLRTHLLESIELDISKGHYDLLHGYIGKSLYLINTDSEFSKPDVKELLDKILNSLESTSKQYKNGIYWLDLEGRSENSINLGLAHGVPSVLVFLGRIYDLGYKDSRVKEMIYKIISFLLECKNKPFEISTFPDRVLMDQENDLLYFDISNSRLAWCYGDLGILYTILYISEILETEEWSNIIECLVLSVSSRSISDSGITHFDQNNFFDIGFCHGISGILFLSYKIKKYLKYNDFFIQRYLYWHDQLLINLEIFLQVQTEIYYPFDKQNSNKDYTIDKSSFFNGVTAAALVLMSIDNNEDEWANLIGIY